MAAKGESPFIKACAKGDLEAMKQNFTSAALSMTDNDGKNALHFAAIEGRVEAIEWLIEQGFPVDTLTSKGLTAFHFAVAKGHPSAAHLLHAAGCDPSLADSTGRTALHLACNGGNVDLVRWLVEEAGLSVHDTTSEGMSPCHFAALGGSPAVLSWLAQGAADQLEGLTHTGMTCVHLAAMKGHLDALQWLTAPTPHGAGLPCTPGDSKKRTPLHMAVVSSSAEAVRYLLEQGADPRTADAEGKTCLVLAQGLVANDRPGAGRVKELLEGSIMPPAPPAHTAVLSATLVEELGVLVGEGEEARAQGDPLPPKLPAPGCGVTSTRAWLTWEAPEVPPAGKAALEYSVQVARQLQARMGMGWVEGSLVGLGPDGQGGWGEVSVTSTPHCFACVTGLQPNTGYSMRVRARNVNGWGPWGKAEDVTTSKAEEAPAASKAEVGEGAGGGAGGGGEGTPAGTAEASPTPSAPPAPAPILLLPTAEPTLPERVAEAASKGEIEALEASEAAGEDVKGVDDKGRGVLHHGAMGGQLAVVRWAMGKGWPVDGREKLGATPLLLAVIQGHLPVVKALAAAGANLDACDLKGYTSLHYAALKGRVAVFRWLCEAGADTSGRNYKGQTARALLDGKLAAGGPAAGQGAQGAAAPAAAQAPTKEEQVACTYMLSLLANAESVPPAPPCPVLVEGTKSTLYLSLPPAKPVAGCPVPVAYEVQYTRRSGLGLGLVWSTLSDCLPTGICVYSSEYLVQAAVQGGAAAGGGAPTGGAGAAGPGLGESAIAGASTPNATPLADSQATAPATGSTAGPRVTPYFCPVLCTLPGLQADSKYAAQVRARNARGWGPWSQRSPDMPTKPANDASAPIKAEILLAAAAAQAAAAVLASEFASAGAAGGAQGGGSTAAAGGKLVKFPATVYYKPADVLANPAAHGVSLPSSAPDTAGTAPAAPAPPGSSGAGQAAPTASAAEEDGGSLTAEMLVSESYEQVPGGGPGADEEGGEGYNPSPNPLLQAAARGTLLPILTATPAHPAAQVITLARTALLAGTAEVAKGAQGASAVAQAWLGSKALSTRVAGLPAEVAATALLDAQGMRSSPQAVLVACALAAARAGHTRTLQWLAGGGNGAHAQGQALGGGAEEGEGAGDMRSPAAAESAVPSPLPPAEAAALQVLHAAACSCDSDGRGVSHAAALGGHMGTVKWVLAGLATPLLEGEKEKGESLKVRMAGLLRSCVSHTGTTLLHMSAYGSGAECLGWLLSLALCLGPQGEGDMHAADTLHGWTPLHYAAAGGAEACFLLLARDMGCDSAAPDASGRTVAHLAAAGGTGGALAILAYLQGTQPALLSSPDRGGLTPLHYAALADAGPACLYLLAHAPQAPGPALGGVRDAAGRTAADIARAMGSTAVATLLEHWKDGALALPPQCVHASGAAEGQRGVLLQWKEGREAVLHVLGHKSGGPVPAVLETQLGPILAAAESRAAQSPVIVQWVAAGSSAAGAGRQGMLGSKAGLFAAAGLGLTTAELPAGATAGTGVQSLPAGSRGEVGVRIEPAPPAHVRVVQGGKGSEGVYVPVK